MLRRWASLLLLTTMACGGTVETIYPDGVGGTSGSGAGATGGALQTGGTGGASTGGVATGGEPAGGTGGYVDPGCEDRPPPPPYYECDPRQPEEDCPEGYACYPFVAHPYGTGCGTQQFGALCALAGTGRHGDPCGNNHGPCAPGFLCVVGASPGKRCAKICPMDAEHDCPAGLICGETDIAGYGVCY